VKITISPFTTLAALVQYRLDHELLHGPFTRAELQRDTELTLQIEADRAVAEHIRHVHEMAEALRAANVHK
jgi:hypothetical protein